MKESEKLDVPQRLKANILLDIRKEERRVAQRYLLWSLVVTPVSAVGIIFSIQSLIAQLHQSSFYSYFSLLFSDTDIVLAHSQEFALSLLESLPFMGITVSLVAIVALLVSIKVFARNTRNGLFPLFSHS
ncbi:MAG: hypothetical protein U1D31_03550 [Patescibacteria group bacterium]|nr:hypothetical protein [bacterium]MDZ4241167.1 hypothetical protein [Patescibacteria group bacterium]